MENKIFLVSQRPEWQKSARRIWGSSCAIFLSYILNSDFIVSNTKHSLLFFAAAEAFEKAAITGEIASRTLKAYLSKRRTIKDSQSIDGLTFIINYRSLNPLKSYQEAQESMKQSRVDLAQLKVGVGAKLKRKCEPLFPTSASTSKKKVVKKVENLKHPPSPSYKKENPLVTEKDPSTPLPRTTLEETARVEGVKAHTSVIPFLPSISTPHSGENFTKMDDFYRSMKSALHDLPLDSGSDTISQNINYYCEQAEVSESHNVHVFLYSHVLLNLLINSGFV